MSSVSNKASTRRYRFADLTLDLGRYSLWRGTEPIALSRLTYDLLRVLVEQAPNVVSNDELAERTWGSRRVVTPENIAKRVMLLRQALGDDADQPRYIECVRAKGYRLIPDAAEVQPQNEAAEFAGPAGGNAEVGHPRLRMWSALVVALLLAGVAGWLTAPSWQSGEPLANSRSIAVLPFENLSKADVDVGSFTQGIHDDLITHLAAIENLKVTPRASVLDYRSQARNRRRVGNELGVEVILDGSIQRAGNQVRVNVQLIDTGTDEAIWGKSYDRELSSQDTFAVQKQIASAIAQELETKLTLQGMVQVVQTPTQNMRALDLFMSGRDYERPPFSDWEMAAAQYRRAVEEDPQFALAHARLSLASLLAYYYRDHDPARVTIAKAAAEAAVRLNPNLALGRVAMAYYLVFQTADLERAAEELAAAAPHAQDEPQFFSVRAALNERLGKRDEARADRERALQLSGKHPARMLDIAIWHSRLREYDEAQRLVDRALDISPDFLGAALFGAQLPLLRDGDGARLRKLPAADFADDPFRQVRLVELQWLAALYERDYAAALLALEFLGDAKSRNPSPIERAPAILWRATALRAAGDVDAARELYAEGLALSHGQEAEWHRWRAAFLAGYGHSEEAVRIGRQLLSEITPSDESGNTTRLWLIREVLLPAGAHALAVATLDEYLSRPGIWSIEGLLPDPRFDPIRDEPSFKALIARHARR